MEVSTAGRIAFLSPAVLLLLAACGRGGSITATPSQFPIPGVRQITTDSAFYRDLMWSTQGEVIAARRCVTLNRQAQCFGIEETIVLVNVGTEETQELRLDPESSRSTSGFPVAWSIDGMSLVIGVGEAAEFTDTEAPFYSYHYVVYDLATETYLDLPSDVTPIGWNKNDSRILIERPSGDGLSELAWLDLKGKGFEIVGVLQREEGFFGRFTLSPDSQFVLVSDSPLESRCNELRSYPLVDLVQSSVFLSLSCFPAWSHDGNKLAYAAKDNPQGEPNQIMIADADGSGPNSLFGDQLVPFLGYPTWAPDGTRLAFTQGPEGGNAVYVAELHEILRP